MKKEKDFKMREGGGSYNLKIFNHNLKFKILIFTVKKIQKKTKKKTFYVERRYF